MFDRRANPLEEGETYFHRSVNMMINNRVKEAWSRIGVYEDILKDSGHLKYFKYYTDKGESVKYTFAGPNKNEILYAIRR